jgi:hypothetical protein
MVTQVSFTTFGDGLVFEIRIQGVFKASASGAVMDFQWAQDSAAVSTTLYAGSRFAVTKID